MLATNNSQISFKSFLKLSGWISIYLFSFSSLFGQGPTQTQTTEKLAFSKIAEANKILKNKGSFEKARNLFDEALNLGLNAKNVSVQNEASLGFALIEYYKANYDVSYNMLDSISEHVDTTNKLLIANFHKLIGNNLVYKGKYVESYEHQLKSLEYFLHSGDKENQALLYFSIGNNFFYQNQYELAEEKFQKAEDIWTELEDTKGRFWAIGAIGSVNEYLGKLDKAMEYSEKALALAKIIDSPQDVAWGLYNIGSIATSSGQYDKAIQYLTEAKNTARELDDKPLLGYSLEALTTLHIQLEEYPKAIIHLDESFEIAEKNNDISNLPNLYKLYSEIHYAKNDLKSYRKYIDNFINLKDSLKNTELAQSMGDLKKDFETREYQKIQEIELLTKDREIYESRQLTWIIAISFATIIFILFTIFMRINNRLVKEKNQILQSSNQRILHQNEQLKTSNRDLQKYAYIISHDLKEPLRNISSFTTLLQRSLGNSISENSKDYMQFIKNGVFQMNDLLGDLLNYSNIENKPDVTVEIDCEYICKNLLKEFTNKNASINIGTLPAVKMKQEHFETIIYHLVSNSIKFNNNNNPKVYIESTLHSEETIFSVSDNGIGINNEYHDKIFEVFQRLNNRKEFPGSGIGLAACKKIISEYEGSIWLESKPGIGSTFYFSIPTHHADSSLPSVNQELSSF